MGAGALCVSYRSEGVLDPCGPHWSRLDAAVAERDDQIANESDPAIGRCLQAEGACQEIVAAVRNV